ncbi:DUF4142 domain-containing protein [Pedobacter mendelii]|uniref:DUF4142 domain-containing protein n=1 Tax=Pedobacter mendelii TaxID=1908240 RepID=A0ABQ2BK20_9SPHI|nr:DUF4142 domain-containing protein [Pedobacter mendelii]GGI26370.1 hypothetical protein GCM10008119_22320 [Pedobacter mendelii]
MKKIFLGLAIYATITFQSCQSADKKSSTMKDSVSGDTTMVNGNHVTGAESTESSVDEEGATFLKKAVVGGIIQIEAAKIAIENAKSTEVKNFAQQMLTDHVKALKEIKDLAIKKKIITPDALPAEEQIHIDAMKKITGSEFDKHYIDMMVNDHDKVVTIFKQGEQNKDSDLKKLANKTLSVIEGHTEKAKEIALKIK